MAAAQPAGVRGCGAAGLRTAAAGSGSGGGSRGGRLSFERGWLGAPAIDCAETAGIVSRSTRRRKRGCKKLEQQSLSWRAGRLPAIARAMKQCRRRRSVPAGPSNSSTVLRISVHLPAWPERGLPCAVRLCNDLLGSIRGVWWALRSATAPRGATTCRATLEGSCCSPTPAGSIVRFNQAQWCAPVRPAKCLLPSAPAGGGSAF